jgi:hypothetical protein
MKPYALNTEKRNHLAYKHDLTEHSLKNYFYFKTIKRQRKEQRRLLQLDNKKARKQLKQELHETFI